MHNQEECVEDTKCLRLTCPRHVSNGACQQGTGTTAMSDEFPFFAIGKSAMVWCNYLTGRPHPIPPSLRFAFEQMEGRAFPLPQ